MTPTPYPAKIGTQMGTRWIATKNRYEDLDPQDLVLIEELRELRETVDDGVEAKEQQAPAVIGALRGRGVAPELIAEAYGVSSGRIYQIPPVGAV